MVFLMKKYALLRYCLVFLAIVLPYFSAATINGPERVLAERVPDMEEYLPVIVFYADFPGYEKRNHKGADCDRTVEYSKVAGRGKKSGRDPEGKRKHRGSLEIFFCRKKADL